MINQEENLQREQQKQEPGQKPFCNDILEEFIEIMTESRKQIISNNSNL